MSNEAEVKKIMRMNVHMPKRKHHTHHVEKNYAI